MAELSFDCIDVRADPFAAGPTLLFRVRVAEISGEQMHALLLRCQLRIEPHKRRYSDEETAHLDDLFGNRSRYADTLRAVQLANVAVMVASFSGSIEVDVPVPCTYDLDVASARYFHALREGAVPIVLLFSGTIVARGTLGFEVTQVPWHKEATVELPVAEWRRMMDVFFPNSGWLRLSRETLDALGHYKNAVAAPTWEQAVQHLLSGAAVDR